MTKKTQKLQYHGNPRGSAAGATPSTALKGDDALLVSELREALKRIAKLGSAYFKAMGESGQRTLNQLHADRTLTPQVEVAYAIADSAYLLATAREHGVLAWAMEQLAERAALSADYRVGEALQHANAEIYRAFEAMGTLQLYRDIVIENRYDDAQGKGRLGSVEEDLQNILMRLGSSTAEAERRAPEVLRMIREVMSKGELAPTFDEAAQGVTSKPSVDLQAKFDRQLADPPLFADRPDRSQTPIAFYDDKWRPYAEAKLLYLDHLNEIDPKLVSAIRRYCSRHELGGASGKYLPPIGARRADDTLIQEPPGSPAYLRAAARIAQREKMAERRATKLVRQ